MSDIENDEENSQREINNMTFSNRKGTDQDDQMILKEQPMNLKNLMDDPEGFGFNINKLMNGDSLTRIESMFDTIDRQ
jgi:hypothetical protein